jgi:hypothetical protein
VQQAIADVAAAALAAAKHPTPPTEPAKMSASNTAVTLRIVSKAYPPSGRAATQPVWRFGFILR